MTVTCAYARQGRAQQDRAQLARIAQARARAQLALGHSSGTARAQRKRAHSARSRVARSRAARSRAQLALGQQGHAHSKLGQVTRTASSGSSRTASSGSSRAARPRTAQGQKDLTLRTQCTRGQAGRITEKWARVNSGQRPQIVRKTRDGGTWGQPRKVFGTIARV